MAYDRGTILVLPEAAEEESYPDTVDCKDIRKRLVDDFASAEKVEEKQAEGEGAAEAARDHMCVYLRVRPLSNTEKSRGEDQGCMEIVSEHCLVTHAPEDSHTFKSSVRGTSKAHNKFTFSRIFPEDTTQKEFFDDTMMGTVKEFIDGQNCLIFTYGVTNSGKTYTIQGSANDAGILPRSLDVIFNSIAGKQMDDMSLKPKCFCDVTRLSPGQAESERLTKQNVLKLADVEEPDVTTTVAPAESDASAMTINSTMSDDSLNRQSMISMASSKHSLDNMDKTNLEDLFEESRLREDARVDVALQGPIRFAVWVSFMEIYNDQVFDLLEPPPKKKTMRRTVLQLKEDKNGVPYVRGLKEVCANSADEAYKILTIGKKNLQIACTKLNHNSSRSHCVFTVKMVRVVDKDDPRMARMSMLSFCDLAGSERHSKTQSLGDRIKEAGNINTSLLTLGRCIKTLRHNQLNKEHPRIVPFRDSKLTRIFQSFFCGKGRASMVVNVNQLASLFDETLHALKYSAIAKQVIVVQEPEKKEPEAEVRRAAKKKRIDTLLLEQESGLSRATVGWATPGTIARVIEQEESAANHPLPGDDSGDEDGGEEYLDIIEDLKQQLLEEKRKNRKLEREIRAEVSAEMAQQLVMIEEAYSERLRDAIESAEEIQDKRIELLTKSIRKTVKRKRVADDDDDSARRSSQAKLEEKEKEIGRLGEAMAALEKRVSDMMNEKQSLQEKCTKMSFDNSSMKEQLKEATSMMMELQALCEETREQLLASEERLRDRDARITQLEAAVQGKECDGCRELEEALNQKEDQLTKAQQMVDLMSCDLNDKSDKIEELEKRQPTSQNKEETRDADTQTQAQSDADTVNLKNEIERQSKNIECLNIEIERLQDFVSKKEKETTELNEKLVKSDDSLKSTEATLKNAEETVIDVNRKMAESEQQRSNLQTSVSSLQSQLKAKSDELVRLGNAADLNSAMKERLNCLEEEAEQARTERVEQANRHSREISKMREKLREVESCLQSKEMDLTERGTEIFEILEKRAELESELTRVKEALAAEEKEKQDTVEALELLKGKISSMESALDEATAESDRNVRLEEQIVQLKGALDDKNNALESLKKEVGGLRRSLDDVTGLEESLQHANDMLRGKANEVATLEAKVGEKETAMEKITSKCAQLQQELDASISQASEKLAEGGQWKEQYLREKEKLKKLSDKLSNMEVENGMLKAENDKSSSESESSGAAVKALREALAAEKEEHVTQVSALRKTVSEKSAKLEKQQTELFKVRANLENEHKEQLELRSKVHSLESECHYLTRKLQREKEGCEESRAHVSKLELRLHESEAKLKDELGKKQEVESSVQGLQEQVQDLSKKVGELQEAVAEGEETEIELQEAQAKLEQASQERERHMATIRDLETQLTQVTSESGEAAAADGEEKENLRCKIKSLQKAVDDAEYKHQMSARQQRREKSQMDKLLKETETAAKEAEDRVTELENELTEVKAVQGQLIEDKVNQYRTRATKLEDIVRDLEHCLRSSKDSETKVTAQNEEYRAKFKEQEKRLADLEDQLKESQDSRDSLAADSAHDLKCAQAILRDKEEQLDEVKQEIKTLQDLIDRNAFDYGQQVFEKNERIHQLEEEAEMLRHQADDTQLHSKIHDLQEQLSVQTTAAKEGATKVQRLESQLSGLRAESKESNAKVIVLQKALDAEKESAEQNASDVKCLRSQVETLRAECENRCAEIHQLKELLGNERNNAQDMGSKLTALQDTVKSLEKSSADKAAQLTLASDNLKDCEEELTKNQSLVSSLQTELAALRQNSVDTAVLSGLNSTVSELKNEVKELSNKVAHLDDKCALSQKELSEKKGEVTNLQRIVREHKESVEEARGQCRGLEKTLATLREEHSALQRSRGEEADALRQRVEELSKQASQVSELEEQIASLEKCKESQEGEVASLKAELTSRDNSMKQCNAQLKEEAELLSKQLQHSQENESTLRGQLREAKNQMEDQNRKFSQIEDKVRSYDVTIETKTSKLKDLNCEVQSLKGRVDELLAENKEKESEMTRLASEARKTQHGLELEVKAAKADLERKEKRLEIKNRKIEELAAEVERERSRYEIAYKDSQGNEEVLNRLKATLEEQEQVMNMQDAHIRDKEEEVAALTARLEAVTEKYNALLKESGEKTSELRQLEQMKKRLTEKEGEVEEALREASKLRQQLKQLQGEQQQLQTELKCRANEIKSMEASLADVRKDRESLRRQLESSQGQQDALRKVKDELAEEHKQNERSRGQAEQLRTKFMALEEQNKLLEKEGSHFKEQLHAAEQLKIKELEKWREERDKLVGKLQNILAEKDATIRTLKAAANTADCHEELTKLKKQNEDKDLIIAELSSHLENHSAPKTRHARRGKSMRGGAHVDEEEGAGVHRREIDALNRKMDELKRVHEDELKTLVLAKDEIICALKDQNKQLEKQIPMKGLPAVLKNEPVIEANTPVHEENKVIQCDLDDTPTLQQQKEKASKSRSKRAGRGKKRRSSEMEEPGVSDDTVSGRKSRGGKRQSSRQRGKSVRLEESSEEPPPPAGMCSIKEEDVVDLSIIHADASHSRILHNSTNLGPSCLSSSTPKTELRHATFISPVQGGGAVVPPSTTKKKRKLQKTENLSPFAETPSHIETASRTPDAHQIVKRQLRSRKR